MSLRIVLLALVSMLSTTDDTPSTLNALQRYDLTRIRRL